MADYTTLELYRLYDPNSSLTDDQIEYYIDSVSAALASHLDREMETTLYQELHQGFNDNVIISREWPITRIHQVVYGPQYYASINVSEFTDNSQWSMSLKKSIPASGVVSSITATITKNGVDTPVVSSPNQSVSDFLTDIANVIGADATTTITIDPNAAGVKATSMWDGDVEVQWQAATGQSFVLEFSGNQLGLMPRFTKEGERVVNVGPNPSTDASNSMLLVYTAGYTMPNGSDYGTLPRELVDVANAMVKSLSDAVANPVPVGVRSEKLGNASYTYANNALGNQTAMGLVSNFEHALNRYVRKDLIYV